MKRLLPHGIEPSDDEDDVLTTVGGVTVWAPPSGGSGSLEVEEDGVSVATGVTKLNFTGDITTTDIGGGEVEVDVTGSGATSPYHLDNRTLHGTYGDHFTSSTLDAKWTRVGYVSGDEQHQMGGGTWMQIDTPRVAANHWYQTCPSGDFTVVSKMMAASTGNVMVGPFIIDNTGKGVASFVYASGEGYYVGVLAGGVYNSSSFSAVTTRMYIVAVSMQPVWCKLEKSGTNYRAAASVNGQLWRKWTGTVAPASFTPTRMGFGSVFGTPDAMAIDWFDVE